MEGKCYSCDAGVRVEGAPYPPPLRQTGGGTDISDEDDRFGNEVLILTLPLFFPPRRLVWSLEEFDQTTSDNIFLIRSLSSRAF